MLDAMLYTWNEAQNTPLYQLISLSDTEEQTYFHLHFFWDCSFLTLLYGMQGTRVFLALEVPFFFFLQYI